MIVTEPMALEAWDLLAGYYPEVATKLERQTSESITALYRVAARATHPDHGGSSEAFVAVDRAKAILLEWLKKKPSAPATHEQRDCPDCDGKGYFVQSSGRLGRPGLRRQCPRCHGSGDLDLDLHGLY